MTGTSFRPLPWFKRVTLWPALLLLAYLIFQPNIFGPVTQTFAMGGDQHLIVNPILSHASKFDALGDPLIRVWEGAFDLYHSHQFNLRYPFFFLWAGDMGGLISTSHHAFLITHLHHMIGGLGAFTLARVVGVLPLAALAAGLFFMLCLNNTLLSPFYWRLAATAWTPFALAGVWLITSGKAPVKGVLLGAPCIALLVFAKSTQPLAYFAYLAVFFGIAGLWDLYNRERTFKAFAQPIIYSSILVMLSVLMSFPVLFNVIQHQEDYVRWTTDGPIVGNGFKVSYEASQQFAYPLEGIWNVLIPLQNMFSIGSSFIGPAALLAIIAAWFSKSHRPVVVVLSFVCVYFIMNGFGDPAKVSRLTYQLPVLSSIRQLTSHYVLTSIAASVLVGVGFDKVLSTSQPRTKWVLFALAIGIILITFVGLRTQNTLFERGETDHVALAILITSPLLVSAGLFFNHQGARFAIMALAIVFMVYPASSLRTDRIRHIPDENVYLRLDITKDVMAAWAEVARLKPGAMVSNTVKSGYPSEKARLNFYQIGSLAMYEGLRAFNVGYTPRPYDEYKHFTRFYNNPDLAFRRGAEFHLTDQPLEKIKTQKSLELIKVFGRLSLYRVHEPDGLGDLVCRNSDGILLLKSPHPCKSGESTGNITLTKRGNTRFTYDISPTVETYARHWGWNNGSWRVSVNGEKRDIVPVSQDRIAVEVSPGDKSVTFTYMPRDYRLSWIFFIFGIIGWTGFLWVGRKLAPAVSKEGYSNAP